MRSVVFQCHTSRGGVAHFKADYTGFELVNIRSHISGRLLKMKDIEISFCPEEQYLEGEYDCSTDQISDLAVFRRRSTAERQANMIGIAQILKQSFNL